MIINSYLAGLEVRLRKKLIEAGFLLGSNLMIERDGWRFFFFQIHGIELADTEIFHDFIVKVVLFGVTDVLIKFYFHHFEFILNELIFVDRSGEPFNAILAA